MLIPGQLVLNRVSGILGRVIDLDEDLTVVAYVGRENHSLTPTFELVSTNSKVDIPQVLGHTVDQTVNMRINRGEF
jgi:hypothetical protein